MTEDFDLPTFRSQVEDELLALDIPGWLVESRSQERLHSPPPEIEIRSLLPGATRRERLSERIWQQQLRQELIREQETLLIQLVALQPEEQDWREELDRLKRQQEATPETLGNLWQKRQEVSKGKARELVAKREIRDHVCHALQTASDDAFEIAKIITPILIGLVTAGTISVALLPVLFASIALVIARMGIASLCGDNADKNTV